MKSPVSGAGRPWLWAGLLVFALIASARSFIVLAPSVFLAGNEETILVINPSSRHIRGQLLLANNPELTIDHAYEPVALSLAPGEFRVVKVDIHRNFTAHIDLTVTLDGNTQKRTFKVSQRTGHIFVQTDKPIYNPKEKVVHVRFIAVNEDLRSSNQTYRVQIRNPDDRLVLSRDFTNHSQSMFSLDYELPEDPDLGDWSIDVLYGDDLRQKQRTKFEMLEYVLPTFRVDVDVADVLLPSQRSVAVKVTATQVYGKPVVGQVRVKEFLKAAVGDPQQYGLTNWTALDGSGEARIVLDLQKYKKQDEWQLAIVGKRLMLEAEVFERGSGKTEVVLTDKTIFAKYQYKASLQKSQKAIRPGYPALVTVRLTHANDAIAAGVPVHLKAFDDNEVVIRRAGRVRRTDAEGVVSFSVPTNETTSQIRVEIRTDPGAKAPLIQATLFAYRGREFVALKKAHPEQLFRTGETVQVETYFQPEEAFKAGLVAVIAAGRILLVLPMPSPAENTVSFSVTPEMSPLARVVAVGWTRRDEVSVDSFVLSSKPNCRHAEYEISCSVHPTPGGLGNVEILNAEKDTVVGMAFVDEAVYALKKRPILTKDTIFNKLRDADRGCVDGGGIDLEESVVAAGLVLLTEKLTTSDDKNCQAQLHKRRLKRAAQLWDRRKNKIASLCCQLGHSNYMSSLKCDARAKALINEFSAGAHIKRACEVHFVECCDSKPDISFYGGLPGLAGLAGLPGLPVEDRGRENSYSFIQDDAAIPEEHVRKDFRESFLFQQVEVTDASSIPSVDLVLPHSITTWSLETISVNPRGGICAYDPIRIPALKEFFIQLDVPYKVVRNEHVQLKVTLYNYLNMTITGYLYIYGVEGVCTEAAAGRRSDGKNFHIAPFSTSRFGFPVFPTHNGTHDIRVEANTPIGSDAVVKKLLVVPEGREVRKSYSVALDPTNSQRRRARSITCGPACNSQIDPSHRNQTIVIDTTLPEDVVDGTQHAVLSVIGEKMGPAVVTALDNIDSLLTLPKGCGEQNMMRLAPLVFITEFRKSLNQLDPLTEQRAREHIMLAFSRQMDFRKKDGSFSAFKNRRSSVWLTAFVAKVFCRAAPLFEDKETFAEASQKAISWLARQQKADGSFEEIKPILHKALLGGIRGRKALTAFVTLAFEECTDDSWKFSSDLIPARSSAPFLNGITSKAKAWLASRINETQEGYTAALMAYALANTNMTTDALRNLRDHLVANLDLNTYSISRDDHAPLTVEGNGYALLAASKTRRRDLSLPLSNWLVAQQSSSGGFLSTQDTVVALQALSEYFSDNRDPKLDLSLLVKHGKHFKRDLRVADDSAMTLQTMSTHDLGEKMYVQATGSGTGVLSVLIKYNTVIPPAELCIFNVTITASLSDGDEIDDVAELNRVVAKLEKLEERNRLRRKRSIDDSLHYRLEVCVFLFSGEGTAMSVIQVDMVTGFAPLKSDLVRLRNVEKIDRFEILPDRVYLYVPEFLARVKACYDFRVVQEFTVNNAQPAAVRVYDYYSKAGNCPSFYELRSAKRVLIDCENDRYSSSSKICTCIQNTCPPRAPFNSATKNNLRTVEPGRRVVKEFLCAHDFALFGKVLSCTTAHRNANCVVAVNRMLYRKPHVTDDFGVGSDAKVTFSMSEHCQKVMVQGLNYLILSHFRKPHLQDGLRHLNQTVSSETIIYPVRDPIAENILSNFEFVAERDVQC